MILLFSLPVIGHVIVLLPFFYGPTPCMYLMMAAILYVSYIDTVAFTGIGRNCTPLRTWR